ncbi:MAG: DNA cytosine methyltransferase [Peptostreptococcaceae bacterium]
MIAVSFFSGAGGMDIGIEKSGFKVILNVEFDKKCCETLILNNESLNVICDNINNYSKERVYLDSNIDEKVDIELIFGGSPCQSFSVAGKRKGFLDDRGKSLIKFIELIEEIKPKAFLLENVKGLLSSKVIVDEVELNALDYIISLFKSYNVNYKLINSAYYGVPQKRERVFLVGIRNDINKEFNFPKETHKDNLISVEEVFNDIKCEKHTFVKYSDKRLYYMKLIPKSGGNWRDLDDNIVKDAMGGAYNSNGGRTGYFRRIKLNEPSPTLLTSPSQNSTNLGHPLEDRPLSIEEYMAIQGFEPTYLFSGSIRDKYRQIGNAVPIKVGFIIGKEIFNTLNNDSLAVVIE